MKVYHFFMIGIVAFLLFFAVVFYIGQKTITPKLTLPFSTPTPINQQANTCIRAGCNSELCVESSQKNIVSTCIFKDEYSCLKFSRCEKQLDGKCGWTQTQDYLTCLNKFPRNSLNSPQ